MKSIHLLLGVLLAASTLQAQTLNQGAVKANTEPVNYVIGQQEANSQVWQTIKQVTNDQGSVTSQTNQAYVELATGLNHLVNGQWVASSEQISISPDGSSAMATNGQHQVYFPGNVYSGLIKLVTPDGQTIQSQPIGLSYFDGTNSVLIAAVTNSTGAILPSGNQVIYTNAFDGLNADLLYTYTKAGFEQDIVLREQPPDPVALGLNPATTRMQVLTEFFNPPQPSVTATTVPTAVGNLEDDDLSFGTMAMRRGRAFLVGNNELAAGVTKRWLLIQGRQFLIEEVPIVSIASEIDTLPPYVAQAGSGTRPVVSKNLTLPPQRLTHASPKGTFLAKAMLSSRGFVLDYVTINSDEAGYTFQGDTTYYISDAVYFSGTNTFEGGAVIKYATNASITLEGGADPNCFASTYRPVIFTAQDDNSVGAIISGSTGNPTNYYANTALTFESLSPNLSHIRIAYAQTAIALVSENTTVLDSQFENCQFGFFSEGGILNVENVLFANVQTNFDILFGATINAENTTFSLSTCFSFFTYLNSSLTYNLTNCILANVAYLSNAPSTALSISGDHNGFYNSPAFGSNQSTNTSNPFQAVGAGNCYLTNGCNFFDAGTNNIDSTLLAGLQTKTTHPPIIYSNTSLTTNLILSPQALRDTNAIPDLGYHYDPVDYIVDYYAITNATLTLTNGVVLASYNEAGIQLQDGSTIVSTGTPLLPNWLVRYQSVQEQPVSLGMNGYPPSGGFDVLPSYISTMPNGAFQFTKFACPAGGGDHLYDYGNSSYGNLVVQECEFWSGTNYLGGTNNTVATLENSLFARSVINASGAGSLSFSNSLVWGTVSAQFNPSGTNAWYAFNNDFDSSTISSTNLTNGYNAYLSCTGRLSPTNAYDIVTNATLAYQTGPFGTFYQPTNSPLIQTGSTNANQVGLYHYTVTTNEVVEGTNLVSIGYHYVATGTNGLPLDSNGNGIPDYLEDPAGNGQPFTVTLIAPLNGASYGGPTNIPIQATVIDWRNLVTNMEFFQGTVQISAMTNAPYTYTWPVVAGAYSLTAVGQDNGDVIATSTPINVTVTNQSLILWLRADLGVTNSAGQISAWADESGQANTAKQNTSSHQPLYVTNALNGLPVVQFNGTNYFSLPSTLFNGTTGAEALVVLNVATNPPGANQTLWEWGNYNNNGGGVYYPNTSGAISEDFGSAPPYYPYTVPYTVGAPIQSLTQYHVYEVAGQASFWGAWINGVTQASTTNNNYGTWGSYYLGGGLGAANPFVGDVAEVLVFNRTLSANERLIVNNYLNLKYALVTNAPPAPTNLVASAISSNQISLTWNFNLGPSSTLFAIGRSTASNGVFAVIGQVANALSYVDTNLVAGTTYYYEVAAQNTAGTSGYSNLAWATTLTNGISLPFGNLILWLKADTGVVRQSTNNSVATWFDQSGNYDDGGQSTAANQPFYITNADNGLPVIRFNGSQYFRLLKSLTNTTAAEVLVVLKVATNPPSAVQSIWGWGGSSSPSYYPNTSGQISDDFGSSLLYNIGAPLQPLTQYHLYNVSGASGSWGAWVNGVAQTNTTSNTFGAWSDFWYLGAGKSATPPFNGDIAEVLVFNRTLSLDERDAAGGYLAAKYGLAQYATNAALPGAPTNFLAIGLTPYQLNLQWASTSTNVGSFHVERELGANGPFQEIAALTPNFTNFVDTTASPTNVYFYRVRAHNLFGDAYSSVISPPTVSMTNWPGTTMENTTNSLGAQAADANGTVSSVSFFVGVTNNEALIGTATSVPYAVNWVPPMEGTWSLAAMATDSFGNSQFSTPVTVIVYLDSNGDGIPDYLQVLQGNDPLNPWVPPSGDTNSTPPTINLIVPANTTLLP